MMTDEPQLRESLRQSLESNGYHVLESLDEEQTRSYERSLPVAPLLGGPVGSSRFGDKSRCVLLIVSPSIRNTPAREQEFNWGPLAIDFDDHAVKVAGNRVRLSATEFSLLRMLAERAGKLVTYRQIMRKIWGRDNTSNRNCMRAYACLLRKKLRNLASRELVLTEQGLGYRLASV